MKFAVLDEAAVDAPEERANGTEETATRAKKAPQILLHREDGESVFARGIVFTRYAVRLQFRSFVMGGIPRDPKIVEGWLRTRMGLSDKGEELRQATIRTLIERGVEGVSEDMSFEQLEELSKGLAAEKQTNGFKRDADGLVLETRAVKAGLKEWVNILYAGQRVGPTKKGPKSYAAERVFLVGDLIPLGRQEPDGVHLFIGHTSGPSGPKSNLTLYEYCHRPAIAFELLVAEDSIPHDWWPRIWPIGEENGLGALRSQGFGRFSVTHWERLG